MSPKAPTPLPPIPPAFAAKKAAILASLAVPASQYKDRSPKGSVDEGIIPLIERINTLDGVVTTSSCAGRVSVFLEGLKIKSKAYDEESIDSDGDQDSSNVEFVVTGGKGNGGRWLFVSHEPVDIRRPIVAENGVMNMLGITDDRPQYENGIGLCPTRPGIRLVRFQFEPMVCIQISYKAIRTLCIEFFNPSLSRLIKRVDPSYHDSFTRTCLINPNSSHQCRLP